MGTRLQHSDFIWSWTVKKNVASQVIGAQMVSATDGSAFTGSVTVYVTGDAGTQAIGSVGSGACTHEGNGFHTYAPAQAETNYDHVAFTFIGTGAVPGTVQVFTSFPQTGDGFARLGAPAGASVSADVAAIKAETATILGDTNDIQTRIPASLVAGRIDASVGAMAANVMTAAAAASDLTTELQAGLATSADLATVAGYLDTEIAAILADTNELQTDWANGGRLDLILDARSSQASVDTIDGIVDAILVDTAEIGAAGAGLTVLASAANLATLSGYVDTEVAAIKTVTDKLNDTLELDTTVYRFTTNALEQAPSGTGASAASIVEAMFTANTGQTSASAVAGSAVYEIVQNAGGGSGLDAAGVRAAIGLASANLDTQLSDLPTNAELSAALAASDDAVLAVLGTPAGLSLSADVAAVQSDTNDIQSRLPAALVGGRIDASVGAMAANVMTAAAAAADLTAELQTGLATAASLAAVAADVGAVLIDTGTDGVVVAAASKTGYQLSSTGVDDILDEVVEGTTTLRQSVRLSNSALGGKASGLDTTSVAYRDLADTKDRIAATVDATGNRTAITRDLT